MNGPSPERDAHHAAPRSSVSLYRRIARPSFSLVLHGIARSRGLFLLRYPVPRDGEYSPGLTALSAASSLSYSLSKHVGRLLSVPLTSWTTIEYHSRRHD